MSTALPGPSRRWRLATRRPSSTNRTSVQETSTPWALLLRSTGPRQEAVAPLAHQPGPAQLLGSHLVALHEQTQLELYGEANHTARCFSSAAAVVVLIVAGG